jgi:ElaB/YqjD/DUF883 family membrane-anchored ribosome-binding protein
MEPSSLAAEGSRSGTSVVESINRGKEAIGSAANEAMDAAATDLESLRRDLNGLTQTLTTFLSQAGTEAGKSARDVSSALAEQGVNVASGAAERSKSLVGDLEQMARRNPLGTLAGAVVLGMLIASLSRRH